VTPIDLSVILGEPQNYQDGGGAQLVHPCVLKALLQVDSQAIAGAAAHRKEVAGAVVAQKKNASGLPAASGGRDAEERQQMMR